MADVLPGDFKLAQALADDRRRLANSIMRTSFIAIGGVSLAVIVSAGIIYATSAGRAESINGAIAHVEKVVFAVLPMVGAWVGTVIAFYFARENFDAAAQNTRALLRDIQGERLAGISAESVMVPASKMVVARTPKDDGLKLKSEVLKRFEDAGLGRIIIVSDDDRGRGVLHESVLNKFILGGAKPDTQFDPDGATLKDALEDATLKPWLENSVVYVPPSATLAQVRQAMEERSRNRVQGDLPTCRDAFVTATGSPTDKVIGYLSDIDIAKHGAYR